MVLHDFEELLVPEYSILAVGLDPSMAPDFNKDVEDMKAALYKAYRIMRGDMLVGALSPEEEAIVMGYLYFKNYLLFPKSEEEYR